MTAAERLGYAREAAALLARIAADRRSPLAAGLRTVEPALAVALRSPETARSAAAALAELPDPDAQRSLADLVLDPSRPADLRVEAARLLVASIQRFGPLLTADQEARLAAGLRRGDRPRRPRRPGRRPRRSASVDGQPARLAPARAGRARRRRHRAEPPPPTATRSPAMITREGRDRHAP